MLKKATWMRAENELNEISTENALEVNVHAVRLITHIFFSLSTIRYAYARGSATIQTNNVRPNNDSLFSQCYIV